MRAIDLTGVRFGRLEAIERRGTLDGNIAWLCKCDCGTEKVIRGNNLRRGNTVSCGCWRKERLSAANETRRVDGHPLAQKHGHLVGGKASPTHYSWQAMKARCLNPKNDRYYSYGGRGVGVCSRWMDFNNFLADMGVRPDGHTLDRIDVEGDYEPSNCRWADAITQANNKRTKNAAL